MAYQDIFWELGTKTLITIFVAIILGLANRIYIGWNVWPGFISLKRLAIEFYGSGCVNFFSCRNSYRAYKAHGTASNYISQASRSVIYVGFWLAHETEISDIRPTIKNLLESGRIVTIVLIDSDSEIVDYCSKFLGIRSDEVKNRVVATKSKFLELYSDLSADAKKRFHLKFHRVPISSSAFLVDHEVPTAARTLVDFKLYGFSRDDSFGIEFKSGKYNSLYERVTNSYLFIVDSSQPCSMSP